MPEQGQTGSAGASSGVYGSGESVGNFVVPPPPLGAQPSQPVNVIASDNLYSDKILVTWNASDNAISYDIYKDGIFLVTTTNTTVDDTLTIPGITYSYYVIAKNGVVVSLPSNSDTGSRQLTEPTNLDANNGQSSTTISLIWNSVNYAVSYNIYRGTSSSTSSMSIVGTTTNTTYIDSLSLLYGTTYYYAVKAVCSTGNSNFSNVDSDLLYASIPNSPIVTASDGTYTDKIVVSWNSVANALHYILYRNGVEIQNTTDLTYNDTAVVAGTVYSYHVMATNFTGSSISDTNSTNSGWKNISAPTGLIATDSTSPSEILLTWNSVIGATSYKIYRSLTSSNFVQIDTSTTPIYHDTNTDLTYGTTYYYSVKAVCSLGNSDFSNIDSGILQTVAPSGSVPSAPTSFLAGDAVSTFYVPTIWNAVTGSNPALIGYKIFRDGIQVGTTTSTTYNDSPTTPATLFTYTVKAYNSIGDSAASTSNTGWVNMIDPVISQVSTSFTNKIVITWSSVTGATSYSVYRGTDITTQNQLIQSGISSSTTTYNDTTSLSAGVDYYYKIVAVCALGSTYSVPAIGNIIYQLVAEGDIFENYFGNNTLKSVNLTINSLNTNNVYHNHFTFEKYNNPMGAITHSSLYALSDNRYTRQIFYSNRQDNTNGGLNYLEKIIVSDFGNYANTFSAGQRLFKNFDVYRGEGDSLYKNDITCIRPTYTSLSAKVIEPVVAPS